MHVYAACVSSNLERENRHDRQRSSSRLKGCRKYHGIVKSLAKTPLENVAHACRNSQLRNFELKS